LGLITLLAAAVAWAQNTPSGQDFEEIQRGRYLVTLGDCAACHTNPQTNQPFAGGRPIETPFGTVVAANITPDADTGIGRWSDAEFDAAVRQGKMPDGSRLYPAMPYKYYTKMSAAEVRAMRAYLRTIAPVHNPVKSNQLPFPFNIRAMMAVWDELYFTPGAFKPDPHRSAQWNRGAYLVQGPGHCAACHTPKNFLGGDKDKQALHGYSLQGWFAPDITSDRSTGLWNWSEADIADYLRKGHNRFAGASGPMAEEVGDSSSKMNEADLQAIAVYLKDLPADTRTIGKPLSPKDPVMVAGAAIYSDLCAACHKLDGSGVPYLIPNLAGSAAVAAREPTTLVRVVLEGANTVATDQEPTGPQMPAYAWQLTDAQVAAVGTYIRNSWGHASPSVSEGDVSSARAKLNAKGG
jgi:mono/diheme cytochrome c family protein